jgi:hypothetical protein
MDAPTLSPIGPSAPVSAPAKTSAPRPIIGDFIRRPEWLWLTHVVPIALLLLWASGTYWLINSDLPASGRTESMVLAAGVAALGIGAAAIALVTRRAGRLLSRAQCGTLLMLSLAVMGAGVRFCWFTIPWNEPTWLANQEELLAETFCLAMPGAFYAILVLAAQPLRRHGGIEFGLVVIATIAGAIGFYGMVWATDEIARLIGFPDWIYTTLAVVGAFGGGTAITFLITRATLIAYTGLRRARPALQRAFLFLIAVCGPIGGLYLNKSIPFPVDFQAPVIYILTLLNGGLLMLPVVRSIFWHRVIWLAQCVLFPFSAYFFIVFLPWMPLSLFAMIAAGAGFLMLVPLVLGISHAGRVVDGFREEVRDGRTWPVAVMCLAAVMTLPALSLWSTWRDRESLDEALTYIYTPDYRKDVTYPGSLPALASSLQHLRDAKKGIFLPFLTPLYNQIVFHGLILPDAKINDLQATFFGDTTTKEASVMLRSRNAEFGDWREPTISPDHTVTLEDVKTTEHPNGTAELLLILRNGSTSDNAQYAATVHLPEGVYVTGFALKMGDDFVPARIVEKKTAMWIYEKITEVQMDPGLLTLSSSNDLTLKIAPFRTSEVRQARLEIAYAVTMSSTFSFDGKMVQLGTEAAPAPLAVTTCATEAGSAVLANVADTETYKLHRTPYLDILIDCSRGTSYSDDSLAHAIAEAQRAFPEAKLARVTAINFEACAITSDLTPIASLSASDLRAHLLAPRGGLLQDRFLKRGLLLAYHRMQTGADQARMRPQFVLISFGGQEGRREGGLADFLRLVPDARVILAQQAGSLKGEDLVSRQPADAATAPPVTLWNWDGHFAASVSAFRELVNFPANGSANGLQIFDARRGQFTYAGPVTTIAPDTRFADGVRTWAAQDEAEYNPSLLKDGAAALIGLSKRTGILIPDSSYIAVESMAQWRLMEQKEKQKLANNQVFEFQEPVASPEPATWLLLGFGLLMVGLGRRRQKRQAASANFAQAS